MEWGLFYFVVWILAIAWAIISGLLMKNHKMPENTSDSGIALFSVGGGMIAVGFVAVGLDANLGVFILLVLAGGAVAIAFSSLSIRNGLQTGDWRPLGKSDSNIPNTHRENYAEKPLNPVEPKCQHDWLCGKCRICGETEKRNDMYGHDVVCGKCVRCGKIPSFEYEILKSHKLIQCQCTVCGVELHNWKLVRYSSSREEYQCGVCGKENVVEHEVDDVKYYGGARDN